MVTRYIAPSGGNNTGAGTAAAPWATGQYAWDNCLDGDTLHFNAGTHSTTASPIIQTNISGTNHPRQNVTIEGSPGTFLQVPAGQPAILDLVNCRTCIIQDLTVQDTGALVLEVNDENKSAIRIRVITGQAGYVTANNNIVRRVTGLRFRGDICHFEDTYGDRAENCTLGGDGITTFGGHTGMRFTNFDGGTLDSDSRGGLFNCIVRNNREMGQNDPTPTNNDFGANGVAVTDNSRRLTVKGNTISGNFSRVGTYDYGTDGATIEFFGAAADSDILITENIAFTNHGFIETGTDLANPSRATWLDGGVTVSYNIVYGKMDYQDVAIDNPSNGIITPHAATTPLMLLRAAPNWTIVHNVFDVSVMSVGSGGIRLESGGTYGGTIENMTIRDNIFRMRVNSQALNANGVTALPANFLWDNNLVFRVGLPYGTSGNTGGSQNAVAINSGATVYSYSTSGLAAFRAGTASGDNDIWGSDPLFVDADNADYRLLPGSPAIGTGTGGTNMGAFGSVGGFIAHDDFNRTALASGWGNAPSGGPWTNAGGGTTSTSGTTGRINHTAASQTTRAVLGSVVVLDSEVLWKFKVDKLATGSFQQWWAMLRAQGTSDQNWYAASWRINTTGVFQGNFTKRVAGVDTALTSPANFPSPVPPTYVADTWYWARAKVEGTNPTTLSLKVWRDGDAEPGSFHFSIIDVTAALQVAGSPGIRVTNNTGTTNNPLLFSFDDVTATTGAQGGTSVQLARINLVMTVRDISPFGAIGPIITVPLDLVPLTLAARPISIFGIGSTDEELVYDSDWIDSAVSDFTPPPGVLVQDARYRWLVEAEDNDGLVGSL